MVGGCYRGYGNDLVYAICEVSHPKRTQITYCRARNNILVSKAGLYFEEYTKYFFSNSLKTNTHV